MFPLTAILSLLLIPFSSATPIQRDSNKVTLRFAHKLNALDGSKNLAQVDRARVSLIVNSVTGQDAAANVGINNSAVIYTAQVGVGSPPTEYTLLIDTGSSNTWVLGNKYVKTSTSKNTGGSVTVHYGSANFSGIEYTDDVTLAPGLVIEGQSIGVSTKTSGIHDVDGILGIGPVDLTEKRVSNQKTVPTVTDNLFKEGKISSNELGVFFSPINSGSGWGELSWGGVDTTKIKGTVSYVPVTKTYPASEYWGIEQSITYNGKTILSHSAGIVDTGTTLVLLATDAFKKYQAAVGATFDKTTGLLKISAQQYSRLQPLEFNIGSRTYTLTPNAQIWPRSLNTAIGGDAGLIYLIVGDIGTPSGKGLDFINGYAFLERHYSVFDTGNKRVGLAATQYTDANTN